MPHIRVRGMAFEDLEYISEPLIKALADYLAIPPSEFTLEYQSTAFIAAGGASQAYPFFELLWFKRTDEQKAQVAKIITSLVRPTLDPALDICVFFQTMASEDYFYDEGTQ